MKDLMKLVEKDLAEHNGGVVCVSDYRQRLKSVFGIEVHLTELQDVFLALQKAGRGRYVNGREIHPDRFKW